MLLLTLVFAQGDGLELSQEALSDLLVGQTVEGEWAGQAYVQDFLKDGRTRYQEKGGRESWVTWRI